MVVHLGLRLRGDEADLHISRDNFIGRKKDGSYCYKDSDKRELYESNPNLLEDKLRRAVENYDKNMAYYASLDRAEFESELSRFLEKHGELRETHDLSSCEFPGVYMMVLDEFKQVYIGITGDSIKKRIQAHWNKKFYTDRLVFGGVDFSRLSIECFKALDTTRLFVWKTGHPEGLEDQLIQDIDDRYTCNRAKGGILQGGLLEAMAQRRPPRDLSRF